MFFLIAKIVSAVRFLPFFKVSIYFSVEVLTNGIKTARRYDCWLQKQMLSCLTLKLIINAGYNWLFS